MLAYILLSLLCAWTLLPVEMFFFRTEPKYPVTSISENWTVTTNESVRTNVPLSESITSAMDKSDVIILSNRMPQEEVPGACMEVRTIRASLDVFLGEKRIYSYGNPGREFIIYNEIHKIPLPEGYGGERVSLLLRTNAENAFAGMYPVYVGNRQDIFRQWVAENLRPIFYGCFLLIYGLFLLILAVFLFNALSRDLRIMISAFMTILFGLYILAYHGVLGYVFNTPAVNVEVEYMSLYLVPAAISAFLATIREGFIRKIMTAITAFNITLMLVLFVLHWSNVLYLSRVLPLFHILVLIEGVFALVLLWIDISANRHHHGRHGRNRFTDRIFMRRADRILFLGVLAIILGGMADTLIYNMKSARSIVPVTEAGIDLTIIGVMIFSGCLLQNYFFYMVEHANELRLNEELSGIVYTDPLTGLANRTRCEQQMQEIEEQKADYSILSFDINNLKRVNDTYGHVEGDRLLKGFANILRECFRGSDLIGRMGGDEFIVIMRDTPKSVCAQKIEQMHRIEERYNKTERVFRYDAACGYAHKSELLGTSVEEIYQLADDRMYEEKRQLHEAAEVTYE